MSGPQAAAERQGQWIAVDGGFLYDPHGSDGETVVRDGVAYWRTATSQEYALDLTDEATAEAARRNRGASTGCTGCGSANRECFLAGGWCCHACEASGGMSHELRKSPASCGASMSNAEFLPGVWEDHLHVCRYGDPTHAFDDHRCRCGAAWSPDDPRKSPGQGRDS